MPGQVSLLGRVLAGRYEVGRKLGEGGMGAVYEAVQRGLQRRVALKVLRPDLVEDEVCLERFRREAMTAARLQHPHVVQVTDLVDAPGEPVFLVMERLDGRSLADALRRGPLPASVAATLTIQILSALDAAHEAGVVHRDLKPGNVFLVPMGSGEEMAKVLDFGIAKLRESDGYSRLTRTGVVLGTPRYAAPEQLEGGRPIDARTDLYAVGVLLYTMITGRPPFDATGGQLIVQIHTQEPPDPRTFAPSVSAELCAVIARAMQKDPAGRYGSAMEMLCAIESVAQRTEGRRPTYQTLPSQGVRLSALVAPGAAEASSPPRVASASLAPATLPTARAIAPPPAHPEAHVPAPYLPHPAPHAPLAPPGLSRRGTVALAALAFLGGALLVGSLGLVVVAYALGLGPFAPALPAYPDVDDLQRLAAIDDGSCEELVRRACECGDVTSLDHSSCEWARGLAAARPRTAEALNQCRFTLVAVPPCVAGQARHPEGEGPPAPGSERHAELARRRARELGEDCAVWEHAVCTCQAVRNDSECRHARRALVDSTGATPAIEQHTLQMCTTYATIYRRLCPEGPP